MGEADRKAKLTEDHILLCRSHPDSPSLILALLLQGLVDDSWGVCLRRSDRNPPNATHPGRGSHHKI
jgi:hypothetical protein